MRRRFLVPLALLAAAPFLLAACGGDDSSQDEDDITAAIETSVTTSDPADCTKLQTQKFAEQTNFEEGEAAVESCEEDAADTSNNPDSVEVSDVEVDGETATANVAFTGGGFDGSTLTVALVKEGDQWKLDEITDIPELNSEGFKSAFSDQATESSDIPPEISDCIVQSVDAASDEQIKAAILDGTQESILALFGDCIPGA